jgi:hypothetical protein
MWSLGVQHQNLQAGAGRVEEDLFGCIDPAVEEQRMAGGAQGGCGLVHQTSRCPHKDVFGAPRELGPLYAIDVEVIEVGEGSEHCTLQSRR